MPAVLPAVPSRSRAPAARHGRSPPRAGDVLLREAAGWQTGAVVPSHPIDRLRPVCLALPEAEEKETWGDPTFRVRGKIFAILSEDERSASIKATLAEQAALVATDPSTFGVASHVGRYGWITVKLGRVDPDHLHELLVEAWRQTAPKRLAAAYDAT